MQILIGGVDKSSLYRVNSLEISDEVNARSTCRFQLIDTTGAYHPANGATVVINDNDANLIFGGFVKEPDEMVPFGTSALSINVDCVDNQAICDWRLVAESYDSMTTGAIVTDIITNILAAEGVTVGSIQAGITATRVVFPRIKVSTAIDELAEMSGFTWWVDSDKALYFVDRSTYLAPWNITATSPIRNVQYRRNEDQYRNKQYIRAGQDTTDPQVAIFAGDGERRTFTVAYAIAVTPVIQVDTGAGYVAKTVGIRGLDTGKDWYWNKNEKEISQDDAGAVLTSAHKLKLPSYVGFFPILTVSENASAVTARKAVSGGTGIREEIEQHSSIDSSDAALEIAQGKLVKYARIAGELVFETDVIGLEVGQIITVTFPAHGISAVEFLIDRITISEPFDDQELRYFVHCVDGQALGNWTTFFKALAIQATTFSIRENEVLIKLKSAVDAVTVAESLSYVAAAPETRVGYALVGFSEVGA